MTTLLHGRSDAGRALLTMCHRGRWTTIGMGVLLTAVIGTSSGCYTGPQVLGFAPARSGHGVDGELIVHSQRVRGELLAVTDTALVMASGNRILLISHSSIDEARFEGLTTHRGADVTGDVLELYRLMSRFPGGISTTTLRTLLAQSGQSELTVIRH